MLTTPGVVKSSEEGNYTLAEPLTVFGTIQISSVRIIEEDSDAGRSHTIFPGMKMADLAKAARLRKEKDGGRYSRDVKHDHLEAGEARRGIITLTCVRPD